MGEARRPGEPGCIPGQYHPGGAKHPNYAWQPGQARLSRLRACLRANVEAPAAGLHLWPVALTTVCIQLNVADRGAGQVGVPQRQRVPRTICRAARRAGA